MAFGFAVVLGIMFHFPPFAFFSGQQFTHGVMPKSHLGGLSDIGMHFGYVGGAQEHVPVVVPVHVVGFEHVGGAFVLFGLVFTARVVEVLGAEVFTLGRVDGLGFVD